MSRNSKNAKRTQAAKEMSMQRKGGNPGPAKTQAKHGKKNAWWQKFASYGDYVKGDKKGAKRRTNGNSSTEEVVEAVAA